MITYVYDDLFYSPARALVNPVNTVGTMGSGIAADFKRIFPEMFDIYRDLCQRDQLAIGQLMIYRSPWRWVINFPTRRHFRAQSTLDAIEQGLKKFTLIYSDYDLTTVSFPQLGVGEEGLTWEAVRPVMESYLGSLPISIFIHLADDQPTNDAPRSLRAIRSWLREPLQDVRFERFWRLLLDAIRRGGELRTLDSGTAFSVNYTEARGRQRLSLRITPARGEAFFIPETQLRDLWQYVRRAGYIQPHNLPAGLEMYASYIVALLARIPTLRAVRTAAVNQSAVYGLRYTAPVEQKDDFHAGELA